MKVGMRPVFIAAAIVEEVYVYGITINSLISTQADQNQEVLMILRQDSNFLKIIKAKSHFSINLLSRENISESKQFSQPETKKKKAKLSGNWKPVQKVPILLNSSSALRARLTDWSIRGTNSLVFAEVEEINHITDRMPLMYGNGNYEIFKNNR